MTPSIVAMPYLLRRDRAQEPLGERAVARRDDVPQAREQARLVGRRDAGLEQAVADHDGTAARRRAGARPRRDRKSVV